MSREVAPHGGRAQYRANEADQQAWESTLATHGKLQEIVASKLLLDCIWGPDYGDELEYLRVFVNRLRKKIEPDCSKPRFLLTDAWAGYRFHLPQEGRHNGLAKAL